jgi:hypothetical protein
MLLRVFKEPSPDLLTGKGGGPYKGEKPATKDAGQAEACLARPAITARENSRHKKSACSRLWRYRALVWIGFLHPVTGLTVTGAL